MKCFRNCNKFDKLECIYVVIHLLVFSIIVASSIILIVKFVSSSVLKVIVSIIVVVIQAYVYERIGFIIEGFLDKILKDQDDSMINNLQINEILNNFTNDCEEDITVQDYNKAVYKLLINSNISQEKAIVIMRKIKKKEIEAGLYKNSKIKKELIKNLR